MYALSSWAESHALTSPPLNLSMIVVTNLLASSAGAADCASADEFANNVTQETAATASSTDLSIFKPPSSTASTRTGGARAKARGTRVAAPRSGRGQGCMCPSSFLPCIGCGERLANANSAENVSQNTSTGLSERFRHISAGARYGNGIPHLWRVTNGIPLTASRSDIT